MQMRWLEYTKGKGWLPEPTSWLEVETLSYTPYFQGVDKG